MHKSSRVSYRKKPRRPAAVAPSRIRAGSVASVTTITVQTPRKKMDDTDGGDIPDFEDFLRDVPAEPSIDADEAGIDVVLCFSTRPPPQPSGPTSPTQVDQQSANGGGRPTSTVPGGSSASKPAGDTPLYSNLPSISLKTNPAPTNILSDFGKTIGKGVRQATQQAKIPLNNLGVQINNVATQVATNIPLVVPPPPPPKKSQLESMLEKAQPKRVFQDVAVEGQARVLVMYKEALVMGKDVSRPGETAMYVEVESAMLIGTPIEGQNEASQKKLSKIFGSFGLNGHRDFDFNSLPRFIMDIPQTDSIKMSEIGAPVEFISEDAKNVFLDYFANMCDQCVHRPRHEVIQGTIWSAVVQDELETLASKFNEPDQVNQPDYVGKTALHYAAEKQDSGQAVSVLLGMGADVHVLDDELSTPLHLASRAGNVLAVHSLLRAGADPNSRDLTERTAFFWAASKACDSEDINATERFCQVMEALVDVGKCDVEVRDTEDRTALHYCVDEEGGGARVDTLGALLRTPLNLDPSSVRGDMARTALHFLCVDKVEDPQVLRLAMTLLEAGARVNAGDKRGDTPLHLLLRGEFEKPYPFMVPQRSQLAELLVRYGARIDVANVSGQFPAEAARAQRINLEDAIAKWAAKKEPTAVSQMAADPKMVWNLPRAADKEGKSNNSNNPDAVQSLRSVTARFNRAINDNLSMPWQAESDVSQCYSCRKGFSLLQRKYHCRHCGFIQCSQCTTKYFTMCPPASAPSNSPPVRDRVCDSCFNGMCTSVERASMALLRLSQDREAAKRRSESQNREALGLKAPSAMDKAEMTPQDTALSSAAKARDALGERGDRIARINERTAQMKDNAANFAANAAKLRQQQEKGWLPF